MKHIIPALALALLALTGCASAPAPTPTPVPPTPRPLPTPIAANADWTPRIETIEGLDMAYVPAGCFIMGNEDGRRDESPEHEVCIEQPFWIAVTEVTNGQYGSPGPQEGDNRPRGNLLWEEAAAFCASRGMRLPTEAEWEYAARGPDSLLYPWGSELIDDNLIFERNSGGQMRDVGSIPAGASWVGALDMAGNAMEWTSSLYQPYPYDPDDGRENPDPAAGQRVYRSSIGSYIDFAAAAPIRFRGAPDFRDWFLAFRCARDAEG